MLGQFLRPVERHVDVRADVFLAQQRAEAGVFQYGIDIGGHAGQYNLRTFLPAHLAQRLQVVDTRRVNERHTAHTDDAHLGMVVHIRHQIFKLVGDAEEIRSVDLVHLHVFRDDQVLLVVQLQVAFVVRVNLIRDDLDLRSLCHAAHEEQAGDDESHLDGDGQVKDHGQEESDEQHADVALRVLHQFAEGTPSAHVVGHHHQDTCQAGHRDVAGQRHEHQEDEQQHGGMDDARYRSAAAVVDVGHGTGNGAGGGNTAEERRTDVGNALADEFLVGVVVVTAHAVCHSGGKQGLDGTEHGDGQRRGEEELHLFPGDVGHRQRGNLCLDVRIERADGLDAVDAGIAVEQEDAYRHHDDGHERSRHLLGELRRQGDDHHAEDAHH